jgi:hypothetical protein
LIAEFERFGLSPTVVPAETVLSGDLDDQAALQGLLRRIESLGLDLIELRRCTQVLPPSEQDRQPSPLTHGE